MPFGVLALSGSASCVGILALGVARDVHRVHPAEDPSPSRVPIGGTAFRQISTGTPPHPQSAMNILFVGNSFAFLSGRHPKMVADIAAHDPGGPLELRVQSVTQGGGRLETLWRAGR